MPGGVGWMFVQSAEATSAGIASAGSCRPVENARPWISAASAEGYVSRELAFSAGILLGRELAARYAVLTPVQTTTYQ